MGRNNIVVIPNQVARLRSLYRTPAVSSVSPWLSQGEAWFPIRENRRVLPTPFRCGMSYRQNEAIIFQVALKFRFRTVVRKKEEDLSSSHWDFKSRYSEKLIAERSLAELRIATLFIFHWFFCLRVNFTARTRIIPTNFSTSLGLVNRPGYRGLS